MTKVIKVNSCGKCEYKTYNGDLFQSIALACSKMLMVDGVFPSVDPHTIHPQCPLENAEPVKTCETCKYFSGYNNNYVKCSMCSHTYKNYWEAKE